MDQSKIALVVDHIRALVQDGSLTAGDALPSTRAFAAELGVARGTVVAAYEQLDGEGWIRTRQGAVARVATGAGPARGVIRGGAGSLRVPERDADAPVDVTSTSRASPSGPDAIRKGIRTIDCRPGIPAVTAVSERDWRAAWRAAASAPLRNDVADPLGTRALRDGIAAQLALRRGMPATGGTPDPAGGPSAERVIVTAGTSEAISLITEALTRRLGRAPRIAVEDPGYRTGRRALTSAGGVAVPIPVDDEGLVVDALRTERFDAVMVTPTHQYPLGSVMPVARRRALLELAATRGAVVVEDDYDSEFRHRGDPVPALAALDTTGVVLHVGGFSKVLDPRLRCAYVVVPPGAVGAAVIGARCARGPVVAETVQFAVAHLLRTGAMRRHLGRVRRDYAHKRARIADRLRTSAASGLEAMALSGGLHAVVRWSGPATGRSVVHAMAERGIRVEELAAYEVVAGRAGNGVVLGYGQVTLPDLDRALDALIELAPG